MGALPPDASTLEASRLLRKRLSAEDARRALGLRELRLRARGRLQQADRLLLTPKGLEQASRSVVATARAERIASRLRDALVLDATAGIGSDSLALAATGLDLVSAERDVELAHLAAENLRRCGYRPRVVVADARRPPLRPDVFVIDPDRRAEGRRELDPERWSPALSECLELARTASAACIELAPAVDPASVPLEHFDAPSSWQWTSVDGELLELTLWTGALAHPGGEREVLALDSRGGRAETSGKPEGEGHAPIELALEAGWIAEPDPALVRSGLLFGFASARELAPLGPGIGFLGGLERPADSSLLRVWRVVDSDTVDRKRVRAMLRRHDVGPVTVKKRGHPRSSEELARELRGKGTRRGHLLVTRLADGHRAFLVERADG